MCETGAIIKENNEIKKFKKAIEERNAVKKSLQKSIYAFSFN